MRVRRYLLLLRPHPLWEEVVMGVEVAAPCPMALQGYDGADGKVTGIRRNEIAEKKKK